MPRKPFDNVRPPFSARRSYYMVQKGDPAQQERFATAAARDGFRELAPWFRHLAEKRAAELQAITPAPKKRSR